MKVRALCDYVAQGEEELSFSKDDVVVIVEKNPSGWWKARLGDSIGFVSSDYFEDISDQKNEDAQTSKEEQFNGFVSTLIEFLRIQNAAEVIEFFRPFSSLEMITPSLWIDLSQIIGIYEMNRLRIEMEKNWIPVSSFFFSPIKFNQELPEDLKMADVAVRKALHTGRRAIKASHLGIHSLPPSLFGLDAIFHSLKAYSSFVSFIS